MLNNFIYAKRKDLFVEKLNAGEVLDEAIVFIEDTNEIWNHGKYFAGVSPKDLENFTTKTEFDERDLVIASALTDLDYRITNIEENGVIGGGSTSSDPQMIYFSSEWLSQPLIQEDLDKMIAAAALGSCKVNIGNAYVCDFLTDTHVGDYPLIIPMVYHADDSNYKPHTVIGIITAFLKVGQVPLASVELQQLPTSFSDDFELYDFGQLNIKHPVRIWNTDNLEYISTDDYVKLLWAYDDGSPIILTYNNQIIPLTIDKSNYPDSLLVYGLLNDTTILKITIPERTGDGVATTVEYVLKVDKSSLATVATSGSYNDLTNKPTIPAAVTESTVSGWGFTKNTGTYSKPSSGIPKSDLASAVQTSLGKADTALQSVPDATETDKGVVTLVSGDLSSAPLEPDAPAAAHAYHSHSEYVTPNQLSGKADAFHKHSANDITSGTLAISRIPLGNSSATVAVGNHTHADVYADLSHASSTTTHGVGTTTKYGHVKISNGDVATTSTEDGLVAGMNHKHSNYSTTDHHHNGKYYGKSEIDETVNTINNNINAKVNTSDYNTKIAEIEGNIGETGRPLADRITDIENNIGLPDARAKVLWLGTSIPKGDGASNSYPMMVGKALGVKVYNMAQGGSHLVFDQTAPSWTTYSELSSQYTKHYSLTATIQEYEDKMRPVLQNLSNNNQLGGGTVDAWMRLFTANSFEKCVIPYIDGTIDNCDVVIIDHGFNDKNHIFNLVRSHKDDTKDNGDKWPDDAPYNAGQYYPFNNANAGFGWLQTISDNRYLNSWGVYTATWNELNYVKEGKAWYKSDYFKAYMYLVQQIWKINPKIKIIVGNFYALDFGNPWGEGDSSYITKYVIEANKQIAKFMGFQCVNVYEHTGLANRKIILSDGSSTTDMKLFAPDGIHPSSDTTGESNKRIAEIYVNALRGIL